MSSPLSALCTANEVASAMEAGPEGRILCECKRIGLEQVVGGRGVPETCSINGAFLAKAGYRSDDLE
jgi:hypothetical protein